MGITTNTQLTYIRETKQKSLFDNDNEVFSKPAENILPRDGEALYYGKIFTEEIGTQYFENLLTTAKFYPETRVINGKETVTKRLVAWYGEKERTSSYAGSTFICKVFSKEVLELKKIVEDITGETYRSCLLNLYHDGNEGMGWHTDEGHIGRKNGIASLSFGWERRFDFRHNKTRETVSVVLEHGGLLFMKDELHVHWEHQVPKSKKVLGPRLNLTFRCF